MTSGSSLVLNRPYVLHRRLDTVKVAILACGSGQDSSLGLRHMVEVGGRPLLWHDLMHFASQGLSDFVIGLGDHEEQVKRYMLEYAAENPGSHDWGFDLIDQSIDGGIKRLQPYIGQDTFVLTQGDSVSNLNLRELMHYHRSHRRLATVVAVRPPARFGRLQIDGDQVVEFAEKPQLEEDWISGGLFVLEPGVFDYIENNDSQWEREPLERIAVAGELMAYQHDSFWQRVDTLRDQRTLEALWQSGNAPWKCWG